MPRKGGRGQSWGVADGNSDRQRRTGWVPRSSRAMIVTILARRTGQGAIVMKSVLLLAFLSGVSVVQAASAAPDVVTLRCTLRNSVPRSGGNVPDRPFTWRFKVDFTR